MNAQLTKIVKNRLACNGSRIQIKIYSIINRSNLSLISYCQKCVRLGQSLAMPSLLSWVFLPSPSAAPVRQMYTGHNRDPYRSLALTRFPFAMVTSYGSKPNSVSERVGADAAMIVLPWGNPYLFNQINHYFTEQEKST